MIRMVLAALLVAASLLGDVFELRNGFYIEGRCSNVLIKRGFTICYSCNDKTPKFVVYKVKPSLVDKNNFSRKRISFRPDYILPAKCRSYPKYYSRTGFDKGHLAPNAIFDYDRVLQKQTFLMSNIAPQKPGLNRRLWSKIERFVRVYSKKHGEMTVVTGVCGSIGRIKGGVNIPKWWYKIVFCNSGAIAFMSMNTNNVSKDSIEEHIVPLSFIENACGVRISKEGR